LSIADQWQVIDQIARPERFELPTLRFEGSSDVKQPDKPDK
jgi:hypothetical protein